MDIKYGGAFNHVSTFCLLLVVLFVSPSGTRYRRRGVDKDGHVANYVETEMLVQCGTHVVSYVIVRGSVPVYWTQPGTKYRPPPIIENGRERVRNKNFSLALWKFHYFTIVYGFLYWIESQDHTLPLT